MKYRNFKVTDYKEENNTKKTYSYILYLNKEKFNLKSEKEEY